MSDRRRRPSPVQHAASGGEIISHLPPRSDAYMQLRVRNASRFVSAWTGGGDVDVEVDDGWIEAGTGGGDIDVEVRRGLGDGEKGIDLTTGIGDVTVTLPAGLSVELDVEVAYTRNSRRDYRIDSDLDLRTTRTDEWDFDRGSPRKYIRGSATIGGENADPHTARCHGRARRRQAAA